MFGIIVTRTKRLRPTLLMGVLMTLSGTGKQNNVTLFERAPVLCFITVALHFVSPDKTGGKLALPPFYGHES